MAELKPVSDAENLKKLEELRPLHESLKASAIRVGADIERLSRQLEDAKKEARSEYGTDNIDELRKKISSIMSKNTEDVNEFERQLKDIEMKLQELDTSVRV